MVQVYFHTGMNKRGTWSNQRIVLAIDKNARTAQLPNKNARQIKVAIEDMRRVLSEDSFADAVHKAIDLVDESIHDISKHSRNHKLENFSSENAAINNESESSTVCNTEDSDFSNTNDMIEDFTPGHNHNNNPTTNIPRGCRVKILWPDNNTYFPDSIKH